MKYIIPFFCGAVCLSLIFSAMPGKARADNVMTADHSWPDWTRTVDGWEFSHMVGHGSYCTASRNFHEKLGRITINSEGDKISLRITLEANIPKSVFEEEDRKRLNTETPAKLVIDNKLAVDGTFAAQKFEGAKDYHSVELLFDPVDLDLLKNADKVVVTAEEGTTYTLTDIKLNQLYMPLKKCIKEIENANESPSFWQKLKNMF